MLLWASEHLWGYHLFCWRWHVQSVQWGCGLNRIVVSNLNFVLKYFKYYPATKSFSHLSPLTVTFFFFFFFEEKKKSNYAWVCIQWKPFYVAKFFSKSYYCFVFQARLLTYFVMIFLVFIYTPTVSHAHAISCLMRYELLFSMIQSIIIERCIFGFYLYFSAFCFCVILVVVNPHPQ